MDHFEIESANSCSICIKRLSPSFLLQNDLSTLIWQYFPCCRTCCPCAVDHTCTPHTSTIVGNHFRQTFASPYSTPNRSPRGSFRSYRGSSKRGKNPRVEEEMVVLKPHQQKESLSPAAWWHKCQDSDNSGVYL